MNLIVIFFSKKLYIFVSVCVSVKRKKKKKKHLQIKQTLMDDKESNKMKIVDKRKCTYFLLLLNRRLNTGRITNHNYIVDIPAFIPFCWWSCWMSPLPISNELVVIPEGNNHHYILERYHIKDKYAKCIINYWMVERSECTTKIISKPGLN